MAGAGDSPPHVSRQVGQTNHPTVLRPPSSDSRLPTPDSRLRYDATVSDIHAFGTLEANPDRAALPPEVQRA